YLDTQERVLRNVTEVVDHRPRDPVLASHRACSAAMAGPHTSLLARLARARQFCANAAAEVSSGDTSLLQHDRFHSDDDRHVLPPVPTKGRKRCVQLFTAARINPDLLATKGTKSTKERIHLLCFLCLFVANLSSSKTINGLETLVLDY